MSTTTAPTITVEKAAAKRWEVRNDGEVTATFRTKREADAEAEQQLADALAEQPEPSTTEAAAEAAAEQGTSVAELTAAADEFAALVADKTKRIAAAKAERLARKEWEAAGSEGDAPATPVLDWMNSTSPADKAKASRKATGTTTRKSARPEDEMNLIIDIIQRGRATGLSFAKIGVELDERGITTARGGKWDFAVVAAIAHRHGFAAKGTSAAA